MTNEEAHEQGFLDECQQLYNSVADLYYEKGRDDQMSEDSEEKVSIVRDFADWLFENGHIGSSWTNPTEALEKLCGKFWDYKVGCF